VLNWRVGSDSLPVRPALPANRHSVDPIRLILCRPRAQKRCLMNVLAPQLLPLTVLVVDDDDGVRHIIARKVEQAGYRVLTAGNGIEALTVLEQSGIGVHLVLCDLLMPQLDGYQLADRLAALPNAPEVIFMSAFRSDLESERPILTKPFMLDDLSAAVQRILEKPSRPLSEDHA
jgi:CheY-like chemotaxis protein